MVKNYPVSTLFLYSFILALISVLIWNLDIIYISSGLRDSPYSIFLICPVISFSLILPVVLGYNIRFNRIYIAVILIFMLSIVGFFVAFYMIGLLYHEPVQGISTEKFALIIFYTGLLFSVFTFLVIRILLHKITSWSILFTFLALLLVMPVSIFFYKIFPFPNSDHEVVQTVRYGLPVFFINILFTISTYISLKLSK
jgi:hypothetical protein